MTEPTDKRPLDEPIEEPQLDEYLKGDSSVSRQYRQLPGAEVPASLDHLVLRQAEDAVKRPSRPAWVRWTAPLAVAASAVLVVSIVFETGLRDETTVSSPARQAELAEAPVETKLADEASELGAVSEAPVLNEEIARSIKSEAPSALDFPSPAPPPVAAPVQPRAFEGGAVAYDAAKAVLTREAAKRARSDSIAFAEEAAVREEERPAAQQAMRGQQQEVAGPRDTVDKPEPVAELSYSRPISTSAVNNMATIQRVYSDPETWLKDIRQLRKDNKQEEADREWRRFIAAFPNHEVAETDIAREAKK